MVKSADYPLISTTKAQDPDIFLRGVRSILSLREGEILGLQPSDKESSLCKLRAESVQPLSCIKKKKKKNAKSYDLTFNIWCTSRDSNPGPTD